VPELYTGKMLNTGSKFITHIFCQHQSTDQTRPATAHFNNNISCHCDSLVILVPGINMITRPSYLVVINQSIQSIYWTWTCTSMSLDTKAEKVCTNRCPGQ